MRMMVLGVFMLMVGCDVGQPSGIAGSEISPEKGRHVICWSGGVKIYEGDSLGKVWTWAGGTAHDFNESPGGTPVLVSGDCLVTVQ